MYLYCRVAMPIKTWSSLIKCGIHAEKSFLVSQYIQANHSSYTSTYNSCLKTVSPVQTNNTMITKSKWGVNSSIAVSIRKFIQVKVVKNTKLQSLLSHQLFYFRMKSPTCTFPFNLPTANTLGCIKPSHMYSKYNKFNYIISGTIFKIFLV